MTHSSISTKQFKKISFDIRLGVIICLLPFLIFTHLLFSDNSTSFVLWDIEVNHKFSSNQVLIWSILISFIPLSIFTILYLAISRAWRYSLLPLIITLFLSLLTNFFSDWEEYKIFLSLEGFTLVLMFIENLIYYDFHYFQKFRSVRVEIKRKELLDEIFYDHYGKLNRKAEEVLKSEQTIPLSNYLCRVYLLLEILNKKATVELSTFKNQKSGEKFQWADLNSIFILLLSTSLLFVYNLVPHSSESIKIMDFEIGDFGFNSIHTFVWYSFFRLSLAIILLWCYSQIDFWWRWALLSPIIFYTYQFFEIFLSTRMDELGNIIHLSPILFLVLFVMLVVWRSSSKEYLAKRYKELAENELETKISIISKDRPKEI